MIGNHRAATEVLGGFKPSWPSAHISACAYCWCTDTVICYTLGGLVHLLRITFFTANVWRVLLPVLPLWMVQWKCLGRERPAMQDVPENGPPKVLTAPKRPTLWQWQGSQTTQAESMSKVSRVRVWLSESCPITIQASFNHKRCHQQKAAAVHCHSRRHLQNEANHNHYFKYRPELCNPLILLKFILFAVNEDWD